MIQGDDLNSIREFAVEQPVGKWKNAATANRRRQNRPPFRIPANSLASLLNGIQKEPANA